MIPAEKSIEYRPKEAESRLVYGSKFYKMFKCITFDNGVEFMGGV